jgi:predicted ATPase
MRLKSLYIEQYKNLRNFALNFDGNSFIDVFVGKNGTGKSNLFEALIEIFRHLTEFGSDGNPIAFEYAISYEIDSQDTVIEWKRGKLRINNNEDRKTIGKKLLPDNILIYYSGHNTTVDGLVQRYEETFRKRIKGANLGDSRRFIGIGSQYKSLLLAVLLAQPDDNKAREFISKKLGIASIGNDMRLEFNRPAFANGRLKMLEVDAIENFDPRTHYWGADGITRDFLDKLVSCIKGEFKHGDVYDFANDRYQFNINLELFQQRFPPEQVTDVFRQFDNLKTLGLLGEISIPLQLANGVETTIDYFSDGQFQSGYIYSIVELFKNRNCITLLDEPDSFLHPEWQFDFLKQVFEITDNTAEKNHVLLSSHSATTLVNYDRQIRLFSLTDNGIINRIVNKNYAINQLSANMIKYSEDQQILSILRAINVERKPIFFTEGSTDPDILKTAWIKLYDEPMPFIPIYAFNCVYLRLLLQDERIMNELKRKPVFGLFDFDEAYNEWNYLKDKWEQIETDPYKGLSAGDETKNRYAFLLPVPNIQEVESLVIKNKESKTHYAHKSKMGIEHLFYGDQNSRVFFENEKIPGGSEIIVFKESKKTKFANKIVPDLNNTHFEVFRPIFEFVRSKCTPTNENDVDTTA